jgi:hypothetical protein
MYMATTAKKLTILVEPDVYRRLQRQVGRGNIGRFLIEAARPALMAEESLRSAYAEMAADRRREREAREWSESLMSDSYDA